MLDVDRTDPWRDRIKMRNEARTTKKLELVVNKIERDDAAIVALFRLQCL
jgi:hypothetical protein